MSSIKPYLQLLRPPNLITALTDILGGFCIALGLTLTNNGQDITPLELPQLTVYLPSLSWLSLATLGLYGGGVVLNDYYDAQLDRIERPERPIPSGKVPRKHAGVMGYALLLMAIAAGFTVGSTSGVTALILAGLVILYDVVSKHHTLLGPLNMGLCRGANLMLGISVVPSLVWPLLFLSIIPVTYIIGITLVSTGEVYGGSKRYFNIGLALYGLVAAMIVSLGYLVQYDWLKALPFVLLVLLLVVPPLLKAKKTNQPKLIGQAVKAGILALIPLNAALAAGFSGWFFGILLLLLLPLSVLMAKTFAVT